MPSTRVRSAGGVASHACGLWDLVDGSVELGVDDAATLQLSRGWSRRWTAALRTPEGLQACSVAELASVEFERCVPVRRFSWTTRQRHRPGLEYLVSTGRHHGFESLAEQRLLLAVDFVGGVDEVVSQPFRLRFGTGSGWVEHIPDFLLWGRWGPVVVDVRPAARITGEDRVRFAATAEMALACGWRYLVAGGWRPHAITVVEALSAQRRDLTDPLGLQAQMLQAAGSRPRAFGELAAATSLPAVARAHALHLIWHRRLSINVTAPLTDRTLVSAVTS